MRSSNSGIRRSSVGAYMVLDQACGTPGASDEEIHGTVKVAAYFNCINRVADGLGVDPEPGME